jgi:hypothetical protein
MVSRSRSNKSLQVSSCKPWVERRRPSLMCCFVAMREVTVNVGTISMFIGDRCGHRRWLIDGEEVGPELALRIASWLDGA